MQSFTKTKSLAAAAMVLGGSIAHGETAYAVVRCFNYAGLQSTLVSNGVVVVTTPPDVSTSTLNIITTSPSRYPSRSNHQSDVDHLFFGWEGVMDESGIAGYQVGCLVVVCYRIHHHVMSTRPVMIVR